MRIREDSGGGERVEVRVTGRTKEILGVPCRAVYSREFEDTTLAEETWEWFAQDVEGNVWCFGEESP